MSTIAPAAPGAFSAAPSQQGVRSAYATELYKLMAQLTTRILVLVCALGPFAFAAVLKVQSGTPSDALFGFWVHSSGFAISLVILGFAGSWGFPIIAGVLAGDLFSSEDRHGTWKTILTRSCTREDVFAGKLLAVGTFVIGLTLMLAAASLIAGVILVGPHALVNLSGALTSPGRMLALTVVSWLICLLPVLAYTSLAILFSVGTRNGILGVLGPLLVALITQLLDLIGKGVIVHELLIGSAFDGWHGLFTSRRYFGQLIVGSVVSVLWIVACLTASWVIMRRRDFLTGVSGRGPSWTTPVKVVALSTVVVAALAFGCSLGPTGVTASRLSSAVAQDFNNVTLLQQQLIGRRVPPNARFYIRPQCTGHGTNSTSGPGDWTCNVYVFLPQTNSVPYQLQSVEYDVSVQYNGCYKAQSPPAFVGGATMQNAAGRSVANPLFIVYGCFNIF
ncbi:MAG TPA: ABC transporter permease [Solirubrobacteraceae bacterium]|nr:ABC transporter permease [Solirubrobacteraceae bacterium]